MPIDTHSYLVQRGWKGKGTGLKEGGIERPVIQAQKNNLKGLGKDRDDGFQFWDHVYSVAANAIQIKISDSEGEQESVSSSVPKKTDECKLQVTQTGILSNRRPAAVLRALPASEIPYAVQAFSVSPDATSYDLLALARREAAKKELYSRFHRGAVLHDNEQILVKCQEHQGTVPEPIQKQEKRLAKTKRRKRKLALRDSKEQDISKKKRSFPSS